MLPAALLCLTTLLAGCADRNADAELQRYLQRLARPLQAAVPEVSAQAVPRMPAASALRLEITAGKLGALDFLALTGCEVQVTIGKRNSSLGLMASPSQRLLLDLEYLRLAPACIATLREQQRQALADTLAQVHELKQRQLPALIFNATLAGPEYRQLWQPPQVLGDYPARTGSAVLSALAAIDDSARRWLAGDYRADNLQFELQLSEVARGDGGALLKALALQAAWLRAADTLLTQRMQQGPLCSERIRPAAADILPNVITRYFIGEVQPRSAALGRRQHELLPLLRSLERRLDGVLPAAFRDWQLQREQLLRAWTAAPREHVAQLQALLEPCAANPGIIAATGTSTVPSLSK
ncbi:DUF3080 domain-containing protein [Kineobactrum salinum]|uniref:DUF3080 domain-containing protein n=2 Tax=Kineobactrum salinum TaxID=2708301 RepID=A0A6C0U674_9GAMM|nr:DUF3080 domain-containing protein [Kineobactrum salinum]